MRMDLLIEYERHVTDYFEAVKQFRNKPDGDCEALRKIERRCEDARNDLDRHQSEHG